MIVSSAPSLGNILKYIPSNDANDIQKIYFVDVLNATCTRANQLGKSCQLEVVETSMYQQRQLKSLDEGLLDVSWTVTSREREANFLPVKIPLTKGLIGYRIAVFNTMFAASFDKGAPLSNIKKLNHIQGHDWPDTKILTANGFNVSPTSWYSTLYRSLDAGHYDVILRGLFEVLSEYELYKTPNIKIDANHAFYYPSAIYFFVSKKRPELADLLMTGLESLIETGDFDKMFLEFAPHATAFETLNLDARKVHYLENPLLPNSFSLSDNRLWHIAPKNTDDSLH
ncbi:hypothetical protein [Planctobacterium marinum]|uniref:Solute-binding protein family 3/N-terminal domain-containing protein n=1 Tax=Planctobacterium marinum TaxID=1631968 RepID=A0AA48HKK9_9ALTE|nr:hypothetical protein MACH26_36720 [Planctobacterium marinum]